MHSSDGGFPGLPCHVAALRARRASCCFLQMQRLSSRVSGPSPSLPDCYDIDVELPTVPQPRIADAVATPEADGKLAKVNHLRVAWKFWLWQSRMVDSASFPCMKGDTTLR